METTAATYEVIPRGAGREFPLTFPLGFLKRRKKTMKALYVLLRRFNPGLKNWLRARF